MCLLFYLLKKIIPTVLISLSDLSYTTSRPYNTILKFDPKNL
jgi:hypothetical protein